MSCSPLIINHLLMNYTAFPALFNRHLFQKASFVMAISLLFLRIIMLACVSVYVHSYMCVFIAHMQTQGEQAYPVLRLIRHCGFLMPSKRTSYISVALFVYRRRISNLASQKKINGGLIVSLSPRPHTRAKTIKHDWIIKVRETREICLKNPSCLHSFTHVLTFFSGQRSDCNKKCSLTFWCVQRTVWHRSNRIRFMAPRPIEEKQAFKNWNPPPLHANPYGAPILFACSLLDIWKVLNMTPVLNE